MRCDQRARTGTREQQGAPIGVEDEGDVLHLPVSELLLEADAKLLKACAGGLDVVDGDGDVAEAAAGVGVAAGVAGEGGVGLGAVVVGELEDALALEAVLGGGGGAVVEGEEVEGEGLEFVLCGWAWALVRWGRGRGRVAVRARRTCDEVHAEDLWVRQLGGRRDGGRDGPRCRT